MAKNYLGSGESLDVAAPAGGVAAGAGVLLDDLFGVAEADAAADALVKLNLVGVFELPKQGSQTWALGVRVYWDAGSNRCTTVSTNNTLIGAAVEAVGNGVDETLGKVRLNGSF